MTMTITSKQDALAIRRDRMLTREQTTDICLRGVWLHVPNVNGDSSLMLGSRYSSRMGVDGTICGLYLQPNGLVRVETRQAGGGVGSPIVCSYISGGFSADAQ